MYSNLEDEFCDDPRVVAARNAAAGLHARCDSWSGRQLTNGFVPAAIAEMYGSRAEIKALLDNDLWIAGTGAEDGTNGPEHAGKPGYHSIAYTNRNLEHMAVRAKRAATAAARAENGRKGGHASGEARRHPNQTGKQNDGFASHPVNQTVKQTDNFASENRSKREPPESRDQRPVVTSISSSSTIDEPATPAAAAAQPDEAQLQDVIRASIANADNEHQATIEAWLDHVVDEMLEVAVGVRFDQSGRRVTDPIPWAATLKRNFRLEHGEAWREHLRQHPDADPAAVVSTALRLDSASCKIHLARIRQTRTHGGAA